MDTAARDVLALVALAEPQRARIYDHLASAKGPRTRQDVSTALGIGRTLLAFHLEKLEQAGLIEPVAVDPVSTGRPGRPPQRYQVTQQEISATVPPRRYELLAEILVQSVGEQVPGEPLREAALRVARRCGLEVARDQHAQDNPRTARQRLSDLLTQLGYEPRDDAAGVVLTNCPFQRLRELDADLVCSINAALAAGYLEGLGANRYLSARLRPCPTNCCVVLERST
jgi:predicted ArsR family transcriptional regulator